LNYHLIIKDSLHTQFYLKSWPQSGTKKKIPASIIVNVWFLQNPSFVDHFKRRSENL